VSWISSGLTFPKVRKTQQVVARRPLTSNHSGCAALVSSATARPSSRTTSDEHRRENHPARPDWWYHDTVRAVFDQPRHEAPSRHLLPHDVRAGSRNVVNGADVCVEIKDDGTWWPAPIFVGTFRDPDTNLTDEGTAATLLCESPRWRATYKRKAVGVALAVALSAFAVWQVGDWSLLAVGALVGVMASVKAAKAHDGLPPAETAKQT